MGLPAELETRSMQSGSPMPGSEITEDKGRRSLISMARGWESKAVESQMADASKERINRQEYLTAEQAELRQKREGLLLSRARVLRDLETARHLRYRTILQETLDHLDRELAALETS